jgi:hypothetical protein
MNECHVVHVYQNACHVVHVHQWMNVTWSTYTNEWMSRGLRIPLNEKRLTTMHQNIIKRYLLWAHVNLTTVDILESLGSIHIPQSDPVNIM